MDYKEIKKQISKYLVDHGFTQNEDTFTVIKKQLVGTASINGQEHREYKSMKLSITSLGEGAVDENPISGWNLSVNDQDAGDIWVGNLDEFLEFIKI